MPDRSRSDRLTTQARYLLASVFSAALTLGVPEILIQMTSLAERIAVAIAMVFAYCTNFLIHKHYVFRSPGKLIDHFIQFGLSNAVIRLCEYLAFWLLTYLLDIWYWYILFGVLVTSFIAKFFIYERIFTGGEDKVEHDGASPGNDL